MSKEYMELSSAKVNDNKSIVISENEKGQFILAQRIDVKDGKKDYKMFLRNPVYINNFDGLCNLRDALILAVDKMDKIHQDS